MSASGHVAATDTEDRRLFIRGRWRLAGFLSFVVIATSLIAWIVTAQGVHGRLSARAAEPAVQVAKNEQPSSGGEAEVEVVAPQRGGIQRVCLQPGTIEPYEAADLYAKVSGFLKEQSVDIGSHVKAGELLAKLYVPELEKEVAREEATLVHEQAKVSQAKSQLTAAEAKAKSARVSVTVSESVYRAKSSYRKYREKQLARLTELNQQRAIEPKLVDEAQDYFESSMEAEAAAKESIAQAQEKATAAEADIEVAKANINEWDAAVRVAAAELERSRVMLSYSEIRSPYDGVVTRRTFHRGDFIRAADLGGVPQPILSVERTDKMRVVIHVPDRDVPFVSVGDEAELQIDALPGVLLKAVISRKAESEDADTRSMRTEVDVANDKGLLYRGMYGQARLKLDAGPPGALTIPSAALGGKVSSHRANLRVVENGRIRTIQVQIGADNGVQVEVLSGLRPDQRVVVRATGAIPDGAPVQIVNAAVATR